MVPLDKKSVDYSEKMHGDIGPWVIATLIKQAGKYGLFSSR